MVAPGYFATGLHSCGGSVDIDTAKHRKSLTSQDPVLTLSALQRLATPEARENAHRLYWLIGVLFCVVPVDEVQPVDATRIQ